MKKRLIFPILLILLTSLVLWWAVREDIEEPTVIEQNSGREAAENGANSSQPVESEAGQKPDSAGEGLEEIVEENGDGERTENAVSREKESATQAETPLFEAEERVTKKPFGIKVSPGNSPVNPERFSGFHTGTDFEVFEDELDEEIMVRAVCPGEIVKKGFVNGYGGVIVQSCRLEGEPVTVLYGHVSLAENPLNLGQRVEGGDRLAVLAADESYYTDGERKHLHLAVHKGQAIELRGYVDSKNQLDAWVDFEEIKLEDWGS